MKINKVMIPILILAFLTMVLGLSCSKKDAENQTKLSPAGNTVKEVIPPAGTVADETFSQGMAGEEISNRGMIIEEKIEFIQQQALPNAKANPTQTRETVTYIQGRKVRSESGNRVFIIDFENQKAFNVNPTTKTYHELTLEQLKAAQKVAIKWLEGLRKQMEERLASMPPDERKDMEAKLDALPHPGSGEEKPGEIEVKASGREEKINGFPCKEYVIYEDGKKSVAYWMTDRVATEVYDAYQRELNEGFGDMGPLAGNRVEEWQHIRDKGFPVRVNRVKPILGKISFNKEVLDVKEQSLSPDLFLPPKDYEMVKSPPMPPVGPRGNMPVPPGKPEQGSPQ